MKEQRPLSPMTGQPIPVTVDLHLRPLTDHDGTPITNGHGRVVMNDSWVYVDDPRGDCYAINTVRAEYCQMIYLKHSPVAPEGARLTKQAAAFMEKYGNRCVVEIDGRNYRVYLAKTGNGYFRVRKVSPYWAETTFGCNLRYSQVTGQKKRDFELNLGGTSGYAYSINHLHLLI